MELKLKRHETFSIREGWIEKGIHYINQDSRSMSSENGTRVFGLGSNMVKSLRYWMTATRLASFKNGNARLEELGKLILENDPYLDDVFSLWLIHLYLVTNEYDAPVFNAIFNLNYSQFDKDFLLDRVPAKLLDYGYEKISAVSSLESDISVFLKSYYSEDSSNPENNMNCPLSRLNLFSCEGKRIYSQKMPSFNKLNFRIVYLSILKCVNQDDGEISFNIEDLYSMRNSPLHVLNLSKSAFFQYLEEMQRKNYIKLNKTAGLNVVFIKQSKSLKEVVESYFLEER